MLGAKYKLARVISNEALKFQGTPFGGCIREYINHEYYSELFYQNPLNNFKNFSDKEADPKTLRRLETPNDIDIFMSLINIELFKTHLIEQGFKIIFCSKPKNLYNFSKDFQMSSIRVKLDYKSDSMAYILSDFKCVNCKIDFVSYLNGTEEDEIDKNYISKLEVDFLCNGLMLVGDKKYKLRPGVLKPNEIAEDVVNEIIKQILKKQAVIAYLHNMHKISFISRQQHMMNRGWKIKPYSHIKINYKTLECSDVCPICIQGFNNEHSISLYCCNSSVFHLYCINKIIKSDDRKCPLCRTDLVLIDNDIKMITILNEYS